MKSLRLKRGFVALFLWSASLSNLSAQFLQDDYKVIIKNESGITDIWYAFHKTNVLGTKIYKTPIGSFTLKLIDNPKEVSLKSFPALKRSKKLSERVTKYTTLFVSHDEAALQAVLNKKATAAQKKLVVSKQVPQKMDDYCTDTLTFILTQKDGKLVITPDDKRRCMNAQSPEALESQKIEKTKRGQAAGQKKIRELTAKQKKEKEAAQAQQV